MFNRIFGAAFVAVMLASQMAVAGPSDVMLDPIVHARASLIVDGAAGARTYSPADLEAVGAKRLTTITPWRDQAATFDGVLLRDVLEENGIADAPMITVIAENGYSVDIERRVWETWPVLIATRVNGAAHTRRDRGPLQFVLPMSDDAEAGSKRMAAAWVWMAQRIEVAN